jgi:hypothetical protein
VKQQGAGASAEAGGRRAGARDRRRGAGAGAGGARERTRVSSCGAGGAGRGDGGLLRKPVRAPRVRRRRLRADPHGSSGFLLDVNMRAGFGPRGGGGAVMARRVGRGGSEAKAVTGCDELWGATVQPDTASSLHPCGGQGRSNVARVRRAAQDRRWW